MKAYRYIGDSRVQIIQEEPNVAVVEEFYVDPDERGKHIGRRLMEATCRDADRERVTLYFTPYPFGSYDPETETFYPPSMHYRDLCKFYRSFGFRFRGKHHKGEMVRGPRG